MSESDSIVVREAPGCLLQILWFIFVGWWLGAIAVAFAYLMFIFVITIPLGVAILNVVPELFTLRAPPRRVTPYGPVDVHQPNILIRALWFVVVGWWLAGITLAIGYVLCLTFIGMPVGFLLFDATPALLTLRRTA